MKYHTDKLRTVIICGGLAAALFLISSTSWSQQSPRRVSSTSIKSSADKLVNARWYQFTGPDGDFRVKFPTLPTREEDWQSLGVTVRGYSLVKDHVQFQLLYRDTGVEPNSRDGNQFPLDFSEVRIKDVKEKGITLLRTQLLRRNVYEMETLVPLERNPSQNLHIVERVLIRNGQLYTLTCTSLIPDQKLDERIYQRFFDSFRLISAPQ